jgi:hypothetical protein
VSEPGRPLRRARALSAALLIAVFVAGALVGAAADQALSSDRDRPRRPGRGMEAEILQHIPLDARQRAEAEQVLARRQSEAAALWNEFKPRLRQIVAGTREDLSRVLTPKQLAEYDRLMAERWRRMETRFKSETDKGGS